MPRTRSRPESEWMTVDALPADARARLDHAGEWVGWDRGMTRVVSSGSDAEAVRAEAIRAGVARPILERIQAIDTRPSTTG